MRSFIDRTLFVLKRAVAVAAPAGIIIWLAANVKISDASILDSLAGFFDPFARAIGMDGYILSGFVLGMPANEIVVPIIGMGYMSSGAIADMGGGFAPLFMANGWNTVTAVCVTLFSLMHFPCSTTLWTIYSETHSLKWTFVSFILPTVTGVVLCFAVKNAAVITALILTRL